MTEKQYTWRDLEKAENEKYSEGEKDGLFYGNREGKRTGHLVGFAKGFALAGIVSAFLFLSPYSKISLENVRQKEKVKLDSTYQVKQDSLKGVYENLLEEIVRGRK